MSNAEIIDSQSLIHSLDLSKIFGRFILLIYNKEELFGSELMSGWFTLTLPEKVDFI